MGIEILPTSRYISTNFEDMRHSELLKQYSDIIENFYKIKALHL